MLGAIIVDRLKDFILRAFDVRSSREIIRGVENSSAPSAERNKQSARVAIDDLKLMMNMMLKTV